MKNEISIFFKFFFSLIIICVFLFYFLIYFKSFTYYYKNNNIDTFINKQKNNSFSEFNSSNNLKHNLTNIFKNNNLDLNEYPNVQMSYDSNFFKHNKFLPECCMYYNNYSSDKGCPCITPEQQFFLQRRGGNRNINSFINGEKSINLYFSPSNAILNREDKIFNKFIEKSKIVKTQNEKEKKHILKTFFNLQYR